ncbi:MAG: C13 family peptidase [Bacteroidales bacterium]|nr:C13 family peptidase [Bacteroidales bacterium]
MKYYKFMRPLVLSLVLVIASCEGYLIDDSQNSFENHAELTKSYSDTSYLSKIDALEIVEPVIRKYPDRWVDISQDLIMPNTTIEYNAYGIKFGDAVAPSTKSPEYESWLIVIGPDVTLNGGQKQLHIFVNALSGEFVETWLDGCAIMNWDTSRNAYIDNGVDNSRLMPKELQRSPSPTPSRWAVIISGGVSKSSNYARYWNDCQYIYNTLTQELNYPSNHIFCLVSDGTDPAEDRRTGLGSYDSSPLDFDNDGYYDIGYSATKANISVVFNYLRGVVSSGDEVFVFVTDHGEPGGVLNLWNNETMSPSEFNAELCKLGSAVLIDVVMGQCYSGAFIPYLSGRNRTISTAVNDSQQSSGSSINGFDYFLRYWTDAIYNINPAIVNNHSNGDGYRSIFEQFHYAEAYTLSATTSESPMLSGTPSILPWGHDILGQQFLPNIQGNDNVSINTPTNYSINGLPTTISPTWTCSNNLYIVSNSDHSASIRGNNIPFSQFVSVGASVSATFIDLGKSWIITKDISYVWKPGMYVGYNHIVGNNGAYILHNCPENAIFPNTYGYQWTSSNPARPIVSQNGASVYLLQNQGAGPTTLSVSFYDPFGCLIYVSDQIY